ncbi:hypothetical protein ACX0G9_11450 [Flavitalea flava]
MIRIHNIIFLILLFSSCKSQTTNEKILNTATRAVAAIQEGNSEKFISLIRDNGLDREMIEFDVKRCKGYFDNYQKGISPVIEIKELYNSLGQKLVRVPVYSSANDTARIKEIHLNLLFGPSNLFPLDKLTGYSVVRNNEDSSKFHPLSYWHR